MKRPAGSSLSTARNGRRKTTKRKGDDEDGDEDDNSLQSDGDDTDKRNVSASLHNKQRQEHGAGDSKQQDSNSKSNKKPATQKAPRALTDAFRDFESTFGLSSPSTSANRARSTPSAKKPRQNGFRNSFGDDTLSVTDTSTSDATGATSRRPAHQVETDETTPLKRRPSHRSGAPVLRPPESHKSLLNGSFRPSTITDGTTPTTLNKGKARAIEADACTSGDTEPSEIIQEGHTSDLPENLNHKPQDVTPLLHLSAKKQFKLPSTPSRPSPLSGRQLPTSAHHQKDAASSDVKPLRSLGAISGLNALAKPNTTSNSRQNRNSDVTLPREQRELQEEEEEEEQPKPKWAQLLEEKKKAETSLIQDITELLSPRKKRKGWVPAGLAENASGVIKRLQTGNNLWIHEISRTLSSSSKASYSSTTPSMHSGVKKENNDSMGQRKESSKDGYKKSYESLSRDLNPHLRLVILEVMSPKPASLTWSSQEGGFITAGAAEKLLITRCRLLKDDEEDDSQALTGVKASPGQNASGNVDHDIPSASAVGTNGSESQIEGMVIFSLAAHSRTSSGITMVRKEQARPSRDSGSDGQPTDENQNENRLQSHLRFSNMENNVNQRKNEKFNVYIPASIADLHTQMRTGDEIWAWEPWSVVDLLDASPLQVGSLAERRHFEDQPHDIITGEKALLISRFAVLL